ncbi:DNA helicase UvrD [Rhodococcus rhodnii]|uniref:DNA 3'-5' helicase n=2 Tax=Rhodococcus rhodnii TaxID=38312 RepID=R7WK91_9NOCA|nr:3'-5' exonuclease [Rhodococcus rhodnii]EOM75736.1 hypothetical protein Rrhod_3008 [Rhodococcus rhodnii LMG 5362]TXG89630.1 DNA helicase UvrD [Rhodococcus rhodnii]
MANLVLATNMKAMPKLDGSIKNKVYDFFEKVRLDDTSPGLHIEPIKGAVDRRVRTGRVDLHYRAILFRVEGKHGDTTYIYMGTWPHDEANTLAERSTLRVNPINGALEGIIGELDGKNDRAKRTVVHDSAGRIGNIEPADEAVPFLVDAGYTMADLTERLGLDEALAERAMTAGDDHDITAIAAEVAGWQGSALLELAVGTSIDDIRDKHGFTDEALDDETLDEDDRILAALERPASKMQFAYIEDNEELRRVIEGGDFTAWRTFLHPEQRKYAEKTQSGPFRLSGGAGTGKTVVAIHRARHLAQQNPDARIVLTTFNRTLAAGLEHDLRVLDPNLRIAKKPGEPGIYVRGIDALGNAVLVAAQNTAAATESLFGGSFEVTSTRANADKAWRDTVATTTTDLDAKLATPAFLEPEYVGVVLGNRIASLEQYVKVARPGRGVRLSRPQRIAVWKLIESFRRHNRLEGVLTFPEAVALAAESLRLKAEADGSHIADHVIVDEAQDLHAAHWTLLRSLVAEGPNDLFIAEDSHQRIYGQPVVLARFGIKIVGRSRRLTLNYRTTAENLHFAVSVLSGAEYKDLEQGVEDTTEYRSARSGPHPTLRECASTEEERTVVADQVRTWLDEGIEPSTIAMLTRGVDDRGRFVRTLGDRGIDARALDNEPASGGHVLVLTMHRSKGMEFSRVILAGIDDSHVPSAATLRAVAEEEKAEALLRERSLLYVAASRARDELVVTWSGKQSELLKS